MKMIDAHIHLDHYQDVEISDIIENSPLIDLLLSVSFDLESCKRNRTLSRKYSKVRSAFGYHPEQAMPTDEQLSDLLTWMDHHRTEMIAIGEVGLPYYLRLEQKISKQAYGQYIELLEAFIQRAKQWEKPIVLHAVYDDAPIVCNLLEKYSITAAHFHWFKGDVKTINRMIENKYFISVTPDVVYEEEIQQLVHSYPLEQMMVETDGPWPFEGPFQGEITHPNMMLESIGIIAKIKKISKEKASSTLLQNTQSFFALK